MARPAPPQPTTPDPDETTLVRLPRLLTAGGGPQHGSTPVHDHPGHELVLLDRGRCLIHAEGRELVGLPPTLFFFPAGVGHDQINAAGASSWYCTFHCRGRSFPRNAQAVRLDPEDPVVTWLPALARHHLSADAVPGAENALLLAILERLAERIDRQLGEQALPPPLRAALRHLDRHLAGSLTAHELARAAGVGPGHLRTLFRRHLGTTPQACHRDRRLDLAAKLLRGSYLGVGEAAAACGWRDPEYFSRLFARRFGRSPHAWRRSAGR
jgi:AraC-like DNA-binding protein